MGSHRLALCLLVFASACASDPCTDLCDGIARCREGNAACVAAGATDRDPFMDTCVAQCEATGAMLDAEQESTALDCLECLRAQTDFGACNGEMLLDDTCAETCRAGGAVDFRNDFGPAAFDELELDCLRE